MRYFLISIFSIISGLAQAYLHKFQIDYITFFFTGVLYFLFGIIVGKNFGYKKWMIILILPALGILLFGLITNPLFFYHGLIEICLVALFYFLGLFYFKYQGLITYKITLSSFFLGLLFFSFYINPQKKLKDFEVSSNSLFVNNFPKDYSFTDTNGNRVLLDSMKDKTILIDYCFIGCSPCYKKMKELEKNQKYLSNNDIKIFFVNCGADSYLEFLKECKKLNYSVPQLYDNTKSFIKMNDISSYPYEIILNKGVIVSISNGYNEDVDLYYINHLKSILKKLK